MSSIKQNGNKLIRVSVIMINYNTFELTKNAVDSIFDNTKETAFEIVLVDNGSKDGSGAMLEEYFKDRIKYIGATENLGTSKAFNLGLKVCEGEYVLWLNSDTLCMGDFITELVKYMDDNPECGICGGNLFDFNKNPAHSFRRKLPDARTIRRDRSFIVSFFRKIFKKALSSEFNYTGKPLEVGYITGADMMVRKDIADSLKGFDERIFMYAEESEFTFRVKNAGYRVMSVPDAKMQHLEGASFNGKTRFSERRCRLMMQGMMRYLYISFGEKATVKYLKVLKTAELKHIAIKTLFRRGESVKIARCNRALAKEYLTRIKKGENILEI